MDTRNIALTLMNAFNESRMTFDELSSKTDIPKSALHRYMSGETEKIPLDRFEAICRALGLDAVKVLGWEPVSWDHTIHELPKYPVPQSMVEETEEPNMAKIYRGIAALTKVDREAALSLISVLADRGIL